MIGSLYVTGPAGTGKSSFCGSYKEWLISQGYDAAIVNLDPGAEFVPYEPDVDIRDIISLDRVMSEYNLGPNGAQIVAADLLLENVQAIEEPLKDLTDYYVIFDTPGQIELFSFRPSSPYLVNSISGNKAMIAFVSDAVLSSFPSGYISQKMLYGSIMSRFYKPMLFVLNKIDLITETDLDNILAWERDQEILGDAFMEEKQEMLKDYFLNILDAFRNGGISSKIFPVSAREMSGFEDIYSEMSMFLTGGTDVDTTYRDD